MATQKGKKLVDGKVEQPDLNKKEYKVKKNDSRPDEQDVILRFSRNKNYKVEKLDTDDLPAEISGKKIKWLSNFRVFGEYQEGETYTVQMPILSNGIDIVWYDGTSAHLYGGVKTRVDSTGTPNDAGDFYEIVLAKGDPGTGWTT